MNNDNFFDMVFVQSSPVSTGEALISDADKGTAWLEQKLLEEHYWKNRQIIFFNYK